MNTIKRIAVISLVSFNLLILLYINFTSQMEPLSHLVLLPILLLETLALGGLVLENYPLTKKRSNAPVLQFNYPPKQANKIKPAA